MGVAIVGRRRARRPGVALIVIDASVAVDALLVDGPAGVAARTVLASRPVLDVPAIFAAEVLSAVRAQLLRGAIGERASVLARRSLATMRRIDHPFEPFADRIWELRANVTVYDAWYVALAEVLDATLVTADRRLVGASGPRCEVLEVRTFVDRPGGAG